MYKDHADRARAQLDAAVTQAMEVMGECAVSHVRAVMQSGYSEPVVDTGALMQDVGWTAAERTLHVGNTLSYAVPVHDGAFSTPARPYLTDGVAAALGDMEALCRETLAAHMSGE
ncbi:MAG: hypothetical protein IKK21_12150 [Clostridia bacterium]|nr:hypothetical protein [Clostridia bacterium]